MNPRRILVVRFSAIGDCVMTAWAVTAIRQQWPEAEIVWAVEDRCAPVIDTAKLVNEVSVFDRSAWKQNRGRWSTWRQQLRTYLTLRAHDFDLGLDFQGHTKTMLALRLSGAKQRRAIVATDHVGRLLNPVASFEAPSVHHVERYLAFVESMGAPSKPDLPIMPDVRDQVARFLFEAKGRPLVTIQTGASHPPNRYPISHWNEVAARLSEKGLAVGAIGGADDARVSVPGVLDWVGRLSLRESMAAVAASAVHLAADTGTGHLAAAYGVPMISLFGPADPRYTRPYTSRGRLLTVDSKVTADIDPILAADAALEWVEAHASSP